LSPRSQESYSSLQKFVDAPHQWVLRHKAKLYPGALARIEDNNRQKGTLAHQLVEWLFTDPAFDWRKAGRKQVEQWINKRFPVLLEQQGANLLLPGKARDAEELRLVAGNASWTLIEHLRAAAIAEVAMEQGVVGHFRGGRLGGYIDMLVRNADGAEAVVDLKWGGFKYRCKELEQNHQLQLAVYAVLRKHATGAWPSQAYFLLSEARLAAQNSDFFAGATLCPPADPAATTPVLWVAFEKTWQWRRDQLDKGRVEVVVEATEADADSVPPEGGLAVAEPKDKFDDYRSLTGWPEGA
jgi:RecB family exonuclease